MLGLLSDENYKIQLKKHVRFKNKFMCICTSSFYSYFGVRRGSYIRELSPLYKRTFLSILTYKLSIKQPSKLKFLDYCINRY